MKEAFDQIRSFIPQDEDPRDKTAVLTVLAIIECVVTDIHRIADALEIIAKPQIDRS